MSNAAAAAPAVASAVASTPQQRDSLTYDRLSGRLIDLLHAFKAQYPGAKDVERRKALSSLVQEAIQYASTAADAREGSNTYLNAGQLKHQIENAIQDVQRRFDKGDKVLHYVDKAHRARFIRWASGEKDPKEDRKRQKKSKERKQRIQRSQRNKVLAPIVADANMQDAAETLLALSQSTLPKDNKRTSAKGAVKKVTFTSPAVTKVAIAKAPPAPRDPALTRQTRLMTKTQAIAETQPISKPVNHSIGKSIIKPFINLGMSQNSQSNQLANTPPSSSPVSPGQKRKRSDDEDDFFAALDAPTLVSTPTARQIKRVKLEDFTPMPVIDKALPAEQIFLLGMQYGVQNYLAQQAHMTNDLANTFETNGDFHKHVAENLGVVETTRTSTTRRIVRKGSKKPSGSRTKH